VGIDINPISCLIATAKTLQIDASEIRRIVDTLQIEVDSNWDFLPVGQLPTTVQGKKWYTNGTLIALQKLYTLMESSDDAKSILVRASFSSILLSACREIRHWGYICDNTTPKSNRQVDVRNLFKVALRRFADAYTDRQLNGSPPWPEAQIAQGDAPVELARFPDGHFSCVVTSPPYFGVADYVKAQRLSMEWFDHAIEPYRLKEIGARSKRARADSQASYLFEIKSTFTQIFRVLKPESFAVVIFGQSPRRADVHDDFVNILKDIGFTIELERSRLISAGRRQKPSLSNEIVLILGR
jgi:hypothetical protein